MKTDNIKIRILALENILKNHPSGLTIKQIKSILYMQYGISVDRKTLYDDLAAITRFYNLQVLGASNKTAYKIIPFPS